jgi:hypothetical protein
MAEIWTFAVSNNEENKRRNKPEIVVVAGIPPLKVSEL